MHIVSKAAQTERVFRINSTLDKRKQSCSQIMVKFHVSSVYLNVRFMLVALLITGVRVFPKLFRVGICSFIMFAFKDKTNGFYILHLYFVLIFEVGKSLGLETKYSCFNIITNRKQV